MTRFIDKSMLQNKLPTLCPLHDAAWNFSSPVMIVLSDVEFLNLSRSGVYTNAGRYSGDSALTLQWRGSKGALVNLAGALLVVAVVVVVTAEDIDHA